MYPLSLVWKDIVVYAHSVWCGQSFAILGKKKSAHGLPSLACFARPDTWKHHSLWSASAVIHNWGVP